MKLRESKACKACIERYIGPALEKIGEPAEMTRSPEGTPTGCCDKENQRYHFTYWYPWNDMQTYTVSVALSFQAEDEKHAIEQFMNACEIIEADDQLGGYLTVERHDNAART